MKNQREFWSLQILFVRRVSEGMGMGQVKTLKKWNKLNVAFPELKGSAHIYMFAFFTLKIAANFAKMPAPEYIL